MCVCWYVDKWGSVWIHCPKTRNLVHATTTKHAAASDYNLHTNMLRATHAKVCFFELPLAHIITSRTSNPRVAMDTTRATWPPVCTGSNLSLSCMLPWTVYEDTPPDRLDRCFSSEALQSLVCQSKHGWRGGRMACQLALFHTLCTLR